MTALAALVADLQARGVTLEPRGDRLAVRPVSRLTREELEALRRYKPLRPHPISLDSAGPNDGMAMMQGGWDGQEADESEVR